MRGVYGSVAVAILLGATAGRADDMLVGVAVRDVTPETPIRLNGFGGRTEESQGVRQRLSAKALAIGADATAIVLVTVDTLGIPDELTERVARRLAVRGLSRERLAITATHTHSGPMIVGCANTLFGRPIPADQWARIVAYTGLLEDRIVAAAEAALDDRRPGRVSWGVGRLGFAFNRRTAGGPVDHDLPVMAVHAADGSLRAVLATYACHCVTLSDDQVGGDWAGAATFHLERRHPGCVALVSIGCGADANPRGGVLGSDAAAADGLGQEFADEVDRLLATPLEPVVGPPVGSLERITLPLAALPDRDEWERRGRDEGAVGHHARTQIARLDRGEPLSDAIDYPVQSITFGDRLAWLFLPGEVVVDYALRLDRELDGGRLWIHGYANACPGYVPSERVLAEGGYEGGGAIIYYDIPAAYAPGVEQEIVSAARRQLDAAFAPRDDAARTGGVRPLAPRAALATLRTAAEYRVELFAAEPLVESPVAIAFDPDGSVWVAEMRDYPQGDGTGTPGGRVRRLIDDDGDGRADRAETFLDGIPYPTGVTVWRDGLLVCAAPDVLFARDTDGDGRADEVRPLFSGFATHNYQARVNALEYGLDGWLSGSCGLFGGDITSHATGTVVPLGQRDFRCRPDEGLLEAASGVSQQGRVRDDAGNWFGCTNGTPLMHYPLADDIVRRNPTLVPPRPVVEIAAGPEPGRLFPLAAQVLFALSGPPGRPTAACGVGIYRDDLLGAGVTGNAFTCEPVNNLVHRQVLVPAGTTFTGRRADGEETREFLASTDPWFRPVQVRTGLDGGLWVVDMYRYVIEHPIWIPAATLATLDTRAGADRGRIYRVMPASTAARRPPRLDRLAGAELAAALDTPNGPQRDLVQQRIVWNEDREAITELRRLTRSPTSAVVRLQALATWALLEPPPEGDLLELLADREPLVRREAVRVSRERLAAAPRLAAAVESRAADPDQGVRLEVAAAAGWMRAGDAAPTILACLADGTASDHVAAAAASSLTLASAAGVLQGIHALPATAAEPLAGAALVQTDAEGFVAFVAPLAAAVTAGDTRAVPKLAAALTAWHRRRGDPDPQTHPLGASCRAALEAAATRAHDAQADVAARVATLDLLAHATVVGLRLDRDVVGLLDARVPEPVQDAALAAVRADPRPEVAEWLLEAWPTFGPALRGRIVPVLVERPDWARRLLEAISAGGVGAAEIDLATRQPLLEHADPALRDRAREVLGEAAPLARGDVVARYAAAVDGDGDAGRGHDVFRVHCAGCHRLGDEGHPVGPDIAGYAQKPPEALLVSLFEPNRAVDPRYQAFVVELADGRTVTGAVVDEAASSVTILAAGGGRETLLRRDIESLRGTGRSLMPDGFDRIVRPEDANDLLAFLRERSAPPKSLPGNTPRAVAVPVDGAAMLAADAAEIRGADIVFEPPHGNVGHWHGVDDSVRWPLEVAAEREVDVWIEWACDPGSAGNRFVVVGGDPALEATVESTGGWNRYALRRIGTLHLRPGRREILVRAAAPLRGALMDLRGIHLVARGGQPVPSVVAPPPLDAAAPAAVAAALLDDRRDVAEREALVAAHPAAAADLIAALAAGLDGSGGAEEYRRIPWIWRVAVAAGRGRDPDVLRQVCAAALPEAGASLAHWQAVVLGGGVVNGVSLAGGWPDEAVDAACAADPACAAAWRRAVAAAVEMAGAEAVPTGTRYDALRIVALAEWDVAAPTLLPHLRAGAHEELQMGAVSGLADIRDDRAGGALLAALGDLAPGNRDLALAGLVRTPARCLVLLDAVAAGTVPATLAADARLRSLLRHESEAVRTRAAEVLAAEAAAGPSATGG